MMSHRKDNASLRQMRCICYLAQYTANSILIQGLSIGFSEGPRSQGARPSDIYDSSQTDQVRSYPDGFYMSYHKWVCVSPPEKDEPIMATYSNLP